MQTIARQGIIFALTLMLLAACAQLQTIPTPTLHLTLTPAQTQTPEAIATSGLKNLSPIAIAQMRSEESFWFDSR